MTLGMKSGLDPTVIQEVIPGFGSSSHTYDVRGKVMVENDCSQGRMHFSIPLNDARIIFDPAVKMLCPAPIYQAVLQSDHAAVAQGYTDLDALVIRKALETPANLERDTE